MTAHTSLPALFERSHRVHLNVLSNSAIACYRRCPREFKHRYVQLRRPRRADAALRFGTLFHIGLNAWWRKGVLPCDPTDRFSEAIHAMRDHAEERDVDEFELVKAEELIRGYTVRWANEGYVTVDVERQFDVPLVNPETSRPSKTYRVQGAIDVIAARDGKLYQVEHKTTSSDISPGTDYWRKVSALDPQVSTYQSACRASGFEVAETLYDVVRKIGLRPFEATPEDKRKYTQRKSKQCPFCKKKGNVPGPHRVSAEDEPAVYCENGEIVTDSGGRLYENQHDHDETPEEFRLRIRDHIAGKPEHYFARGPVVRLENDEREHAGDVWQTAAMIRMSENSGHFPRSPGACERFHRLCEYFDVCSGTASIDDNNRFRTAERPHEELNKEV